MGPMYVFSFQIKRKEKKKEKNFNQFEQEQLHQQERERQPHVDEIVVEPLLDVVHNGLIRDLANEDHVLESTGTLASLGLILELFNGKETENGMEKVPVNDKVLSVSAVRRDLQGHSFKQSRRKKQTNPIIFLFKSLIHYATRSHMALNHQYSFRICRIKKMNRNEKNGASQNKKIKKK